ncbi:hypothetical protein ACWD6R_21620 [Streptomyces sp. NPDC005151]
MNTAVRASAFTEPDRPKGLQIRFLTVGGSYVDVIGPGRLFRQEPLGLPRLQGHLAVPGEGPPVQHPREGQRARRRLPGHPADMTAPRLCAVLLLAVAPTVAAATAAVLKAGHLTLHADRHRIELVPGPHCSCPGCRGAGGWWASGPFPEMEACGCWSDRRTLCLPLLPARAADSWPDEPPF